MSCEKCPMFVFNNNAEKDPRTGNLQKVLTCPDCEAVWRKLSPGRWIIMKEGKKIDEWVPNLIDIARFILEGAKIKMKEKRSSHANK